jgi:hypothetical protein
MIPKEVDDVTLAFPASVRHLMPEYKDIPKEFRNLNHRNKWGKMVSDWFFCGLKNLELTPKPGIDEKKALRHIRAIIGSFEPKHEHKTAACAYLLSLWFDDVKYDVAKGAE